LEKIACGDFFETLAHCRRQKAWFLPPVLARSDARAGGSFRHFRLASAMACFLHFSSCVALTPKTRRRVT
jgi:hypothetical protein